MLQSYFADEVFAILSVPKDAGWYLQGVITMGYPTGKWGVGARKPVQKLFKDAALSSAPCLSWMRIWELTTVITWLGPTAPAVSGAA